MIDWDSLVIGPAVGIFGGAVTYRPRTGAPFTITGVFDAAYVEQTPIDTLSPGNVSNARPMLGVQLSQFPAPPLQDDTLVIQSTGDAYWVNEVRPDSHGGARLLLNLVPG